VQIALAVVTVTPQQKAATVVLTTDRPGVFSGAAGITFADQEGGSVKPLRAAPPFRPAAAYAGAMDAFRAGVSTRRALRRAGSTSTSAGLRHERRPARAAAVRLLA
jgi:hypothetical protein